jgi:hypothetical protein
VNQRLSSLLPALLASALGLAGCAESPRRAFAEDAGRAPDATVDAGAACGTCTGLTFTPCGIDGGTAAPQVCDRACVPNRGCAVCEPNRATCVGDAVQRCGPDGMLTDLAEACDTAEGYVCRDGACVSSCQVAANQPSNVGCEFWAVDLDQQDGFNDPASAPWGVALSNVGTVPARITIEVNTAPVGQPATPMTIASLTVRPGDLRPVILPTRELDCGARPNDYAAPGTCLSSNAFRIRSSAPILVYQYNTFSNSFSNDASLLLPATSLGRVYRAVGWPAGHPVRIFGDIIDRAYVTVVGVRENTRVRVRPTWRIRGNAPITRTLPGGEIDVTLGPFDVLNLETDDGTLQDNPVGMADLSGTSVVASEPVAVFSGVESTGAPGSLEIPTPSGWERGDTCCLDHLEDQMFPVESVGTRYVIPRSPVRSTRGFREPDVIRFVGASEVATVTTTLRPPFDRFTLQPGEVRTTWTQDNVVVNADHPVLVGQILVSNQYVDGPALGDPSLTVFPPVDQFRQDYVILAPGSWTQSWAVLITRPGASISIDGNELLACTIEPAGEVGGITWETRRCALTVGVHRLAGDLPFGVVIYGYGAAGSYAFVGGADVRRIYDPPG